MRTARVAGRRSIGVGIIAICTQGSESPKHRLGDGVAEDGDLAGRLLLAAREGAPHGHRPVRMGQWSAVAGTRPVRWPLPRTTRLWLTAEPVAKRTSGARAGLAQKSSPEVGMRAGVGPRMAP